MSVLLAKVPADLIARIRAGLMTLRPSEVAVLREAMKGGTDEQIADALGFALRTAQQHMRNIRKKTDCTRFELMRGVFELRDDAELEAYLRAPVIRKSTGRPKGGGKPKG
jgi:DNA-binding CsgD family transcriptional regulator